MRLDRVRYTTVKINNDTITRFDTLFYRRKMFHELITPIIHNQSVSNIIVALFDELSDKIKSNEVLL